LAHIPAYIPLPEELKSASLSSTVATASAFENDTSEKTALLEALCLCNGNKSQTAKLLGVHRMTVWNRMRKYGIHLTQNIDQSLNTDGSQTISRQ